MVMNMKNVIYFMNIYYFDAGINTCYKTYWKTEQKIENFRTKISVGIYRIWNNDHGTLNVLMIYYNIAQTLVQFTSV